MTLYTDECVTVEQLIKEGCKQVNTNKGRRCFLIREEVVAAECTSCKIIKRRGGFGKDRKGSFGITSNCSECKRVYQRENRERISLQRKGFHEANRNRLNEKSRKWHRENKEWVAVRGKEYREVNKVKLAETRRLYREGNRVKLADRDKKFREANKEKVAEWDRRYREDNKDLVAEAGRRYRAGNKDKIIDYKRRHREENRNLYTLAHQRRRARITALPDDLTSEQLLSINDYFGNACALTGDASNTHLDHVVPLSVGYGGTTIGNMIPLQGALNISKSADHLFEWFYSSKERLNLEQWRFDKLIKYLADINGVSVDEYRAHVDYCHDFPRTLCEDTGEFIRDVQT